MDAHGGGAGRDGVAVIMRREQGRLGKALAVAGIEQYEEMATGIVADELDAPGFDFENGNTGIALMEQHLAGSKTTARRRPSHFGGQPVSPGRDGWPALRSGAGQMQRPPSTSRQTPVTKAASSEHR